MLQQRLEKILEYASKEALSADHNDTEELKDLDDDYISRSEFSETNERTTTVHVTIIGDGDCAGTTDDDEVFFAPALIPSSGSEIKGEACIVDQSAVQSGNSNSSETDNDNFTVKSAPILDERMVPITTKLSQSAHAICCN